MKERHDLFSKKVRRKIRSKFCKDMKPHIFDRVAEAIPHVFSDLVSKQHAKGKS